MNAELEKIVNSLLGNGELTDRSRELLMKKAEQLGVDSLDFELELENKIAKKKVSNNNNTTQSSYKSNTINQSDEKFFSPEGRLGRKKYIIRILLLSIPSVIFQIIIEEFIGESILILSAPLLIGVGVLIIIQAIKRLHDLDLSGLWCLVSFIPLVNFFFGLYLLFAKGTKGPNKYGDDPLNQ